MNVIEYLKKCPVCDSSILKGLKRYSFSHLNRCMNCGFVFAKKIPTEKELQDHYSGYNRHRSVSQFTIKKYNELLFEFVKYKQTGKILDVGCGSGFFMETAIAYGWDCHGTEYSIEAIEFLKAKGHIVYQEPLQVSKNLYESFDVITSFEVIEHLAQPKEHLITIYNLLRPGGLLYITTPNFNGVSRYILKEKWSVISYPEHLNYYTPESLNKMLMKAGFRKKKIITNGISVDRLVRHFRKNNQNIRNSGELKPKLQLSNEVIRAKTETSRLFRILRKFIDGGLNITGTGEFLKAYYIKQE